MITTHVLDTALGRPAVGIPVTLELRDGDGWRVISSGLTDGDGRIRGLVPADAARSAGTYRLRFETGSYFIASGAGGFYPYVEVVFEVRDPDAHHHVPLLLSPFGYSTYRGS